MSGAIRLLLVCEGPTDPPLVCTLVDRLVASAHSWFDEAPTYRDDFRGYCGLSDDQTWTEVKREYDRSKLLLQARFGRTAPLPDQLAARKLFLLVLDRVRSAWSGGGS